MTPKPDVGPKGAAKPSADVRSPRVAWALLLSSCLFGCSRSSHVAGSDTSKGTGAAGGGGGVSTRPATGSGGAGWGGSTSIAGAGALPLGAAGSGIGGSPGAGGGPGGSQVTGGAASGGPTGLAPFTPVDPQVSRLWRWTSCGSIAPVEASALQAIFPPTSDALAVLYDDGRVLLYPKDDSAPKTVRAAGNPPESIAFSPDGTTLAEVAAGVARVRDVATGAMVRKMKVSSACTGNTVRFSAEGDHVLAWDQKSLCVWQTADGALATQLAGNFSSAGMRNGRILTAEFGTPPIVKSWAPSGLEYSTVPLEVPAGMQLASAQTGFDDPRGILVSPRVDTLAGRAVPGLVDVLWAADGSLLASLPADVTLPAAPGAVPGAVGYSIEPPIVYSESGDLVLFGNEVVNVMSLGHWTNTALDTSTPTSIDDTGMQVGTISARTGSAGRAEHGAPSARRLFGALPAVKPSGPTNLPSVLAVSPDGNRLVAGTTLVATLWRLSTTFASSVPIRELAQSIPLDASFSSSGGELVLSGDWWGIFSADDGVERDTQPPPPNVPAGLCSFTLARFSTSGQWLAVGGWNAGVAILARTGLQPGAMLPTPRCVERASFNGDGSLVATSGPGLYRARDGSPVWPAQVTPVAVPASGADLFRDVQFAPGEKTLLVSGCDGPSFGTGCAHAVHSASDGTLVRSLPGLTGTHARFSPEGNWIVSGNTLVHLPTNESIVFDSNATFATFAPNGDLIAILQDNTLARYCRAP